MFRQMSNHVVCPACCAHTGKGHGEEQPLPKACLIICPAPGETLGRLRTTAASIAPLPPFWPSYLLWLSHLVLEAAQHVLGFPHTCPVWHSAHITLQCRELCRGEVLSFPAQNISLLLLQKLFYLRLSLLTFGQRTECNMQSVGEPGFRQCFYFVFIPFLTCF